MKKNASILFFILCLGFVVKAQNLVPNGNFDIYSTCPTAKSSPGNMAINFANGWHAAASTPDYYNSCATINSTVNVPYAAYGYQQDCCGGNGFVGGSMLSRFANNNDDREYIYTKLYDTLKIGYKYLVSMYVSRADGWDYSIATMGMLFTDTVIILPYPQSYINAVPQVKSTSMLSDTLNWMLVQDTITAISQETYLTIGNFNTSATCDSVRVGGNGSYANFANYYIDGVSVYEINGNCNNYWDAGFDKYIFAGDSIRLGAIDTDNSVYIWHNSAGGSTYLSNVADARPWSKPTQTTTYHVTKTCPNNNVFTDTITVYIQQHVGIKNLAGNSEMLLAYPNPNNGVFIIETNSTEKQTLQISDITGKIVLSQYINSKITIDVNDLDNGIYFVQLKTNNNISTQRIIVQH